MRSFIIQLITRDEADAVTLLAELSEQGVRIDTDYGLVPVDPDRHVHVTRGLVPRHIEQAIAEDDRVALFPDMSIGPTSG